MMKLSSMLSASTVIGAVLCASAVAQTRFCIGGDLEHLTKAQKDACSVKMQAVRNLASDLHAPANWHFVVVCGEEGWKQYAAYAMQQEEALRDAAVSTNYGDRETFFRESRLDGVSSASLQSAVAREIEGIKSHTEAHAMLNTDLAGLPATR